MSLLMDALKKAEEEKKEAAKRLQEVEIEAQEIKNEPSVSENESASEDDSNIEVEQDTSFSEPPELFTETAQFSLEPLVLEEKPKDIIKEDVIESNESDVGISVEKPLDSFSEDLTLENTIAENVESQEVFEETQNAIDLNDTTIIEGLSTENASAPFDDTFHGVLFEDEDQEADVYEETLPGIPADQLAKDLGGGKYQPTPVAAKTVFSAGKPGKKQASFKWGVFVVLALLAIGSFAIFYYFTITPVSRTLPSPLIARGIESSGFQPSPITVPPVITESERVVVNKESINTINNTTIPEEIINNAQPQMTTEDVDQSIIAVKDKSEFLNIKDSNKEAGIESETSPELDNKNIQKERAENVESGETIKDHNTAIARTDVQRDREISAKAVKVNPELINISKSTKQAKVNIMVSEAYKAYQDGHSDAAKSIYEGVLKNNPDNRDAHLGLAAIAIGQNDKKRAYNHYVYLLEINPLDTIAMNALIGLSNSADPTKDESAIKQLIQRDDDIPALYFSLGNVYAKQQRWPSAQQAYFDAYRLDSSNPDYVVNLAISLDKMGQYKTALDYYKTAIDLSNNSSVRFDSTQVKNRIFNLSKLVETKQ